LEEILDRLPSRFGVLKYVLQKESTYVLTGSEPDPEERECVDLSSVVERGLLDVVDIATEEEAETFVRLATGLDDGEARTIAVALHRGAGVVTDDRKAREVVRTLHPPVPLRSTSEIMRDWATLSGATASDIRQALNDIHRRGRFALPRHDPLRDWWRSQL
jgi:predicted nucleic acid-binding protein